MKSTKWVHLSALRCLLFVLGCILPITTQAQFTFTTNNGAITITGYSGTNGGVVKIPDTTNGFPVISIGTFAFANNTNVVSVAFGTNLMNIGNNAFYNCIYLTSVTFPNSVTNIDWSSFFSCTNLTSVLIPGPVTNIGIQAFDYCTSLTNITVEATNSVYSSLDGVLFNKNQTSLIQYPAGNATPAYIIPNSVTSIGSDAFSISRLTNVTIGNSVTNIGSGAFNNSASLTNVLIPTNVISIGSEPFGGCYSLTEILVDPLNSNYASLDGVLFNYAMTTIIQYPKGKVGSSYVIPVTVTNVGDGSFISCTNLTNITIPNSVKSIGSSAFFLCTGMTNGAIPYGVTTIGAQAFGICKSLTWVTLGTNISHLDSLAFENCKYLLGFSFQGNAPSLGYSVFSGDTNAIIYYLPGKKGWSSPFGGLQARLWNPQAQSIGQGTNQFGFTITGSSNLVVVVEASTNLAGGGWSPVATNTLNTYVGTNGTSFFSDPQWGSYPARLYRFRSP